MRDADFHRVIQLLYAADDILIFPASRWRCRAVWSDLYHQSDHLLSDFGAYFAVQYVTLMCVKVFH